MTSDVDEKCVDGRALSIWYYSWGKNTHNTALTASGNENMHYIMMPIQSNRQVAAGEKRQIRCEATRSFNAWAITDKAKYPERIIELINWACTDEGQIMLQGGFEDKHWVRNADGKRELTAELLDNASNPDYVYDLGIGSGACAFLPAFRVTMDDGQGSSLLHSMAIFDQANLSNREREAYEKMGWSSSKAWWLENGFSSPTGLAGTINVPSDDPLTEIQTKLFELRVKSTASLILAETEEDFEKGYANAVAEHDLLNPQVVIDKFNELYQAEKAKLN
jgi:putative aldouronate transport system substrate-binding protein